MRVVLDTNILVSSLLVQQGHPAAIYRAWQEGNFTLLVCAEQLDELLATLQARDRRANQALQGRPPG
jgi:predicted nucleic acid-binding protein